MRQLLLRGGESEFTSLLLHCAESDNSTVRAGAISLIAAVCAHCCRAIEGELSGSMASHARQALLTLLHRAAPSCMREILALPLPPASRGLPKAAATSDQYRADFSHDAHPNNSFPDPESEQD